MKASNELRNYINIRDSYNTYGDIFIRMLEPFQSMWDGKMGPTTSVTNRVDLDPLEARPIRSVSYRAGLKARGFEKHQIDTKLKLHVVERAQTGQPRLLYSFAQQKRKQRCDLVWNITISRQLEYKIHTTYQVWMNSLTIRETQNVFSKFVTISGYFSIEIGIAGRENTAITSHHGSYQFSRTPFGFINGLAKFQNVMDIISTTVKMYSLWSIMKIP